MKVFLCLISILFINSLSAQNWTPFPLNVRNVYGNDNAVNYLKCDSLLQGANTQKFLINSKTHHQLYPNCNDTNFNSAIYESYRMPDAYILSNDSCYLLQGNLRVYFNIYANLYEVFYSYDMNEVKCISYGFDTLFLNVMDSVKVFHLIGTSYFYKLSKNYGLFYFHNINALKDGLNGNWWSEYKLIGLNEVNPIGYVPPDANIYYALQPGDVIMWKEHTYNYNTSSPYPMGGYINNYIRDSIIGVSYFNDSIVYKTATKKLYSTGILTNYLDVIRVSTSFLNEMTDYYNNLLFYHSTPITITPIEIYAPYYFNKNDTVNYELGYSIMNYYVEDLNACVYNNQFDQTRYTYSFRKGVGLFRSGEGYFSEFEERYKVQIGTLLNGVSSGSTSLKELIIKGIEFEDDVLVYPNPGHEKIYLSKTANSIQIISLTGSILINEVNTNKVDVSSLAKGIYFMQINSDEKQITKKIVID